MQRKVCAFLFFILVSVFSISAQDSEWYWNQPISRIDFSGLNNVKKSELQGIISSFENKTFTDETYNDDKPAVADAAVRYCVSGIRQ